MKCKVSIRLENSNRFFDCVGVAEHYTYRFGSLFGMFGADGTWLVLNCIISQQRLEKRPSFTWRNGKIQTTQSGYDRTYYRIHSISFGCKTVEYNGLNNRCSLKFIGFGIKQFLILLSFPSHLRLIKRYEKLYEVCILAAVLGCTIALCVLMTMIQVKIRV